MVLNGRIFMSGRWGEADNDDLCCVRWEGFYDFLNARRSGCYGFSLSLFRYDGDCCIYFLFSICRFTREESFVMSKFIWILNAGVDDFLSVKWVLTCDILAKTGF